MGRFFTTRRSEWLPGVALLGVAAGLSAVLGFSLGARSWTVYLGVFLAILLVSGWLERRRAQREQEPPPRVRGKLKLIRGGKSAYDLEHDESTSEQKYLM